jgi:hypothetical protein
LYNLLRSRCSDTLLVGRPSNMVKIIFPSSQCPDLLGGPLSLLSNGHRRLFPLGQSGGRLKLTTHVHLVPRLRKLGAIPTLPHTSSWHREYTFTFMLVPFVFLFPVSGNRYSVVPHIFIFLKVWRITGAHGSVVGWGTMLQARRSRDRVPVRWNFSSFQPHYGPGVDSVSNRNEYQEPSEGGGGA